MTGTAARGSGLPPKALLLILAMICATTLAHAATLGIQNRVFDVIQGNASYTYDINTNFLDYQEGTLIEQWYLNSTAAGTYQITNGALRVYDTDETSTQDYRGACIYLGNLNLPVRAQVILNHSAYTGLGRWSMGFSNSRALLYSNKETVRFAGVNMETTKSRAMVVNGSSISFDSLKTVDGVPYHVGIEINFSEVNVTIAVRNLSSGLDIHTHSVNTGTFNHTLHEFDYFCVKSEDQTGLGSFNMSMDQLNISANSTVNSTQLYAGTPTNLTTSMNETLYNLSNYHLSSNMIITPIRHPSSLNITWNGKLLYSTQNPIVDVTTITPNATVMQSMLNTGGTQIISLTSGNESNVQLSKLNATYIRFGIPSSKDTVLEFQPNPFGMRIPLGLYANSTMHLIYNGTEFLTSLTWNLNYADFNLTMTNQSDAAGLNPAIHQYYWEYDLHLLNGSYEGGDTSIISQNQSVYSLSFDECLAGHTANVTLKLVTLSEDTNISLNTDFEAYFRIHAGDVQAYNNYSFDLEGKSLYRFCFSPNNVTVYADALFSYSNDSQTYADRNYWIHDESLTNVTQYRELFLANESSQLTYIYVRDLNDQPISGAYVHATRYHVGRNEWKLVESRRTDINGQVTMNLYPNQVRYRFFVFFRGRIYDAGELFITNTVFTLNVDTEGQYSADYDVINGIRHSLTRNNNTFTFYYLDENTEISHGCLRISKLLSGRTITLFESCKSETVATIIGTISEELNGQYVALGYVKLHGEIHPVAQIGYVTDENVANYGALGLLFTAFFVITLFFVGLKVAALPGASGFAYVGVVASNLMGLISISTTVMVLLGMITAIVIWGARN